MSYGYIRKPNQNALNFIHENNIQNERKGNLISLIKAVEQNEIKFKNNYEKSKLLDNLQNSLERISKSPKKYVVGYNEVEKSPVNIKKTVHENNIEFKIKGKKHYTNNQNLNGSFKIGFKPNFADSSDRISEIIKYYNELNDKEKLVINSPHSHRGREKEYRRLKDTKEFDRNKIIQTNLSPDNPYYKEKNTNKEQYQIFKFNQKSVLPSPKNIKTRLK